jgi:hypothetical protein
MLSVTCWIMMSVTCWLRLVQRLEIWCLTMWWMFGALREAIFISVKTFRGWY